MDFTFGGWRISVASFVCTSASLKMTGTMDLFFEKKKKTSFEVSCLDFSFFLFFFVFVESPKIKNSSETAC